MTTCRTCYANPCCCHAKYSSPPPASSPPTLGSPARTISHAGWVCHTCYADPCVCHVKHSGATAVRFGGGNDYCRTCYNPYASCCCGTRTYAARAGGWVCHTCFHDPCVCHVKAAGAGTGVGWRLCC